MIIADPNNPRAVALLNQFTQSVQAQLNKLPVHIVIGGDGWMLESIRKHGIDQPYIGLNAGTLGFLMQNIDNVDECVQKIIANDWKIYDFPLLSIKGFDLTNSAFHALALNDVYVYRDTGRAANLKVQIDGVEVVERLVCDGLVVASSLGSTAYYSSAGGSPSHPLIPALHITPICPHTPRLRSFLVPHSAEVTIEALAPERRPVQAVSDGNNHGQVTRMAVRTSEKIVRLAYFYDHNFTETMIRKILRS